MTRAPLVHPHRWMYVLLFLPLKLLAQDPDDLQEAPVGLTSDSVPILSDGAAFLEVHRGCGFADVVEDGRYAVIPPHAVAQEAVDTMAAVYALRRIGIQLYSGSTDGRVAIASVDLKQGIRSIIYDRSYDQLLGTASEPDWELIGVLAHEVGHHLLGHTLQKIGEKIREDDADFFAGHSMRLLGASAETVRQFMLNVADPDSSETHRGAVARAEIALDGWRSADDLQARAATRENTHRRIAQAKLLPDSSAAAPTTGLMPEWIGYLSFSGLADRHYVLSSDRRIFEIVDSTDFNFLGSVEPAEASDHAWKWESDMGTVLADTVGNLLVRLPNGSYLTVGEITAPERVPTSMGSRIRLAPDAGIAAGRPPLILSGRHGASTPPAH